MQNNEYGIGPISAKGCMSDMLLLNNLLPPAKIVEIIDADRRIMAKHPGFYLKLLPLRIESNTAPVMSGGAYLFDTFEDALAFDQWVVKDFEVDGVRFTERDILLEMSSKVWHVLGAHNFKDLRTDQQVMRVEEWRLPAGYSESGLQKLWESLREKADELDLASTWFLYNDQRHELSLVTTLSANRLRLKEGQGGGENHDLADAEAIPSLLSGQVSLNGIEKIFDRTSYLFNIWFSYSGTAADLPSIWPNRFLLPR